MQTGGTKEVCWAYNTLGDTLHPGLLLLHSPDGGPRLVDGSELDHVSGLSCPGRHRQHARPRVSKDYADFD